MILEINNLELHFQVFGDGPALLILHGWGDKGASWSAVAEQLSKTFQVFLIDLPGFGESAPPPTPWSVVEYRETIAAFIREMELEKPFILGHSHGGKVACELVANQVVQPSAQRGNDRNANDQHPNAAIQISGLILVATGGVDLPSLEVRAKIYFFKSCKFVLSFCGAWGAAQLARLRTKLGSRDYQEAGILRDTMVKVVNHKLFGTLDKIRVPTLIIWGSKDSTLSMEQAKIFRAHIPGSYIRILWDATHHPHLEQPQALAEMVEEFYDGYEQQVLS